MLKRIATMLMVVALLSCLSVSAYAHDAVDMDRSCVISVTMHSGQAVVGGGSLSIYRVGEVVEDDGNYFFAPTGDFVNCGEDFSDITSPTLAEKLVKYAKTRGISSPFYDIGDDGSITFPVAPGLYLIVQEDAAEGYHKANPFLVSVPVMVDGVYVYEVDASPKLELEKIPVTPSPTPTPPPKLPQTGQLNWPVPVLVVSGLTLFTLGWVLRYTGKKEDHEA